MPTPTGTTLSAISTRRGDFEDWIGAGMGIDRDGLTVASVFEGAELPRPETYDSILRLYKSYYEQLHQKE